MNEKIKQLAEQAGDTEVVNTVDYGSGRIDNVLVKVFNKEKFAELIIKEVTDLLDREQWDRGQDWICKDGDRIIEKVEEHFGVEE